MHIDIIMYMCHTYVTAIPYVFLFYIVSLRDFIFAMYIYVSYSLAVYIIIANRLNILPELS